jgi:hypothetical protein
MYNLRCFAIYLIACKLHITVYRLLIDSFCGRACFKQQVGGPTVLSAFTECSVIVTHVIHM